MWAISQQRRDLGYHHGEAGLFDCRNVQVRKRRQVDFRCGGTESCIEMRYKHRCGAVITSRILLRHDDGYAQDLMAVRVMNDGRRAVRTLATLSILLQVRTSSSKP